MDATSSGGTVDDIGLDIGKIPLATSAPEKVIPMDTAGSSNIVTLEPYSSPSLNRDGNIGKKKLKNVNQMMQIVPGVYELVSYNKFLLLEIEDNRIENVNVFKAHREIVKLCGSQPKIRPQGDGRLLIEVSSPEQSTNLLSLNKFLGLNARVFPHPIYNQCRGVVYAPQLLSIDPDEIQSELEDQGVIKVMRMKKKVGEDLIPLPTLILTFNSYKLPNSIKAGWLNFKVKPYFPSPLRCYHCQMYGHSIQKCKKKANNEPAVCHNCGKDVHGVCTASPSCIHCGENHPASSRSCVRFIFEKEVQVVRAMEKISFGEAKKKVLDRQVTPGVLFSTVIKTSQVPTQRSGNGIKHPQETATVSVESVPKPGPSGRKVNTQQSKINSQGVTITANCPPSQSTVVTPQRVLPKIPQPSTSKTVSTDSKETKNPSPKKNSQSDPVKHSNKRERTPDNKTNEYSPPVDRRRSPPKLKRMDKKRCKP